MIKKLINQGRTAEIYDIGDNKIVKLFRSNFPLEVIEKEYKISQAINSINLPIPKFIKKIKIENRIGLIFEKIDGVPMLNKLFKKPWLIFYYARKMAEIHALINSKKIKGISKYKSRLKDYIKRTDDIPEELKNKIIGYLTKLDTKSFLCHCDLHPDNILISKDEYFIIDWMTAASGSPEADVARTIVILIHSSIPKQIPFVYRIIAYIFKNLLCNEYLKHYIKLTGIDRKEINKWKLPIAAARLLENGPKEEKTKLKKLIYSELNIK